MTPAFHTPGYRTEDAPWALEATRLGLQDRTETAELSLRELGEEEGRSASHPDASWVLQVLTTDWRAADRARRTVEHFASYPLPPRDRDRRTEEAAALSERVQAAFDLENHPDDPASIRALKVKFRAESAARRSQQRQQRAVPSLRQSCARSPRARGEEDGRER